MNADGSNPRPLTSNNSDAKHLQWSPGSRRLAFTAGAEGSREIYTVNADGRRLVNLSRNGADDFDVKWHPLTPEPAEGQDEDAPETSAALSAPPDGLGWHGADVTLTADDGEGGSSGKLRPRTSTAPTPSRA